MSALDVVFKEENPVIIFKQGLDDFVTKIEKEVEAINLDIETVRGRIEVEKLGKKITKTKNKIDAIGKDLTTDWLNKKRAVDAERKMSRDRLDALKEKVLHDLHARNKVFTDRIEEIKAVTFSEQNRSIDDLRSDLKSLDILIDYNWCEFQAEAEKAVKESRGALFALIADEEERVAKAKEEERLRKAKEEERLKAVADKAKEEERLRVEKLAKEEKERAEQENKKAIEKAEKAIEDERRAKLEAETKAKKAKMDAENAVKKAERDAKLAEEKRLADIEKAKQKAEQEKKEAIEKVEKAIKAENEKAEQEKQERESNQVNKKKVHNNILNALVETGITPEQAKAIIISIVKGNVPELTINY